MQEADLLNSQLDSDYFLIEPKLKYSSLNPLMINSVSQADYFHKFLKVQNFLHRPF
jgi:hypothetical protein